MGFICIISDVNLKISLHIICVMIYSSIVNLVNSWINYVVYVIMLLNNNRISLSVPLLRLPISSIILPQILKIRLYLIHLVHQIYLMVNVILS